MYYIYIIQSKADNKFYTGQTKDLERRLKEHNEGNDSTPSTKKRRPFDLIHVEIVETLKDARKLEKFFKSGYGREIRDELVKIRWS